MTRDEAVEAIRKVVLEHPATGSDDYFVGDFILIAHMIPVEDNGSSTYAAIYPQEHTPLHILKGLLHTGLEIVDSGDDWTLDKGDD